MTSYKFNLSTMRTPAADLHFIIEDDFFAEKTYSPIQHGSVEANVKIVKKEKAFNIQIKLQGYVSTLCTRCMGDMNLDIMSDNEVVVKVVKTPREDDDYVYVTEDDDLDLEPLIYDFIILSIPERHVHADGECNAEMEDQLKQYLVN